MLYEVTGIRIYRDEFRDETSAAQGNTSADLLESGPGSEQPLLQHRGSLIDPDIDSYKDRSNINSSIND